jgi:hypothetical protein
MTLRRSVRLGAVLAAAAVLWSSAAAAPQRRTGPDSFLRYRVETVEALVAQINADPLVRARLAKHFHVSQAELIVYLRENLVVQTVPVNGYYTVYGVTEKTGRIYPTRQYFRKGQKIFTLRDGSPLLKYECGNPLTRALPKVAKPPPPPPPPLEPPIPPGAVGPQPPEEIPVASALETKLPAPEVAPLSSLPPSPVEEQVAALPPERRNVIPILVGASLIPFLIDEFDDECPPEIPEPTTIGLIAFGLLALGALAWRERRAALARRRIR